MIFKILKKLTPIIIITVVAYFFYVTLDKNWDAVQGIGYEFNLLSILAILLFVLSVFLTGMLWAGVLNTINQTKKVSTISAISVQITSWLLKYIPGQAGSLINKIHWGSKNGYSKTNITISFMYENIFLVIASFTLSVPILLVYAGAETFSANYLYLLLPMLVLLPSILLLNKRFTHWFTNKLFTRYKKIKIEQSDLLEESQAAKFQFYFMIPRLMIGVAFLLTAVSFLPIESADYIPLIATYIFAGVVGILAVLVPSGLGVREAVIVILASQFMPVEQAILASLVARLYTSFADMVLALILFISKKRKAD